MTSDEANLDSNLRFVETLVHRILDRLGPTSKTFLVDRPRYYHGFDTDKWEMEFSDEPADDIRVAVRTEEHDDGVVGAHFRLVVDREEAIAATATHVQDYVLECTRGAPLPPCPGHAHPLDPKVHDGIACWVCPKDPHHHVEPILAGHADD